jgi:hypothetical protein
MSTNETLHTDALLRKHQLLVLQKGFGDAATFEYVDWQTHKPAGPKRIAAFEKEAGI